MIINKYTIFLALLVFNTLAQSSSTASFVKANQLYNICKSESKADMAACEGYIMGVNDSVYSGHLSEKIQICMPQGVTPSQNRLIVIKYIEKIPERINTMADVIVAEALSSAFKCKNKARNIK